jgi:F-type H+-transporting ATPase subunit gamma
MKAMDLVAAAKLQKAKSRLDVVRPLFNNIKRVMEEIRSSDSGEVDNAFISQREVKNIAYVVVTSDRGLCGSYNAAVSKEAYTFISTNNTAGKNEKIIAVGSKGSDYLQRRGKKVVKKYPSASEATPFEEVQTLGEMIISMYTSGEIDEVYVVYTHFESILTHVPYITKLLPVGTSSNINYASVSSDEDGGERESKSAGTGAVTGVGTGSAHGDGEGGGAAKQPADSDSGTTGSSVEMMEYEPDINTFMTYAIPQYVNTYIYGAMVESAVCEQSSRMTSMDAATRNASEIIDDLTLLYNRKRQGLITQEITEIVGGANTLRKGRG